VWLVSFVLMGEYASAAKLKEIRIGKKSGFTRLVFQFEALPRFQVKDKAGPNELALTFLETTSGLVQTKQAYTAPVENIAVQQDGPHLQVVVALSTPDFRLKTFTLTEPHRAVFDLYPAVAEESLVLLNKLVVKASAEKGPLNQAPVPPAAEPEKTVVEDPPPPAMEAKPAAVEPTQDTEAPAPVLPEKEAPNTPREATATPAQPSDLSMGQAAPEKRPMTAVFGKFQRNLIIVLAGISIVILALIGFLLLQKRNNAEKGRSIESGQELKTTADVMASIDARIKEKFKQYEEANPN